MSKLKKIVYPLQIFFFSRMAIFSLASVFIGLWPSGKHFLFLDAFSHWDGQWYLRIVNNGYWYKGPKVQSPVPFFPLYPLLSKILNLLGLSAKLSLFLVANISCLGFFVVFWLLIKDEFGETTADTALFYYAISPLSYLFSSLYTESLFLFLACSCFYFLKKNQFLLASIFACLASATRPFGIFLVLPVIFYAWRKSQNLRSLFVYGWISTSGLGFFSLYLYFQVGEWMPFLGIQTGAWHRFWTYPWKSIWLFWQSLSIIPRGHPFFPIAVFDLIIVAIFTILLIFSLGKISFFYQLFVWPLYLMSMSQPWEPDFFLTSGSISRYMFQLFPLVGLLAQIGKRKKVVHYLIVFFFISLIGPFALAFFHGFWVQ